MCGAHRLSVVASTFELEQCDTKQPPTFVCDDQGLPLSEAETNADHDESLGREGDVENQCVIMLPKEQEGMLLMAHQSSGSGLSPQTINRDLPMAASK